MEIMTFGLLLILPLISKVHSWTLLYSMPENQTHQLKKNHRLTTLPHLGKEFKISFDLWVENYHDSNEYNARYYPLTFIIVTHHRYLTNIKFECLPDMETFFTSRMASKVGAMGAKRQ